MKIWNDVVILELPQLGEFRHVGSALEAIDCLYSGWRGPCGEAHRAAINMCLAVLDDGAPTEKSRTAFLNAARISHINVLPDITLVA